MHLVALLGSILGIGMVSGVRLYGTVLTIGLAVRFGGIHLPPELAELTALGHPAVLAAAAMACVCEFFADKVPWFDSVWDGMHTFIRPVGAAYLAAHAIGMDNPVVTSVLVILCGGTALSAHSTKASLRVLVNHSPEPFSNIGLSLGEEAFAVGGAWLAIRHPVLMLVMVAVFLAGFAWFLPKIIRLLGVPIRGGFRLIGRITRRSPATPE